MALKTQQWPQDWKRSVLIPITAIREMHIKFTRRCHLTPIRKAFARGRGAEKEKKCGEILEPLCTIGGNYKMVQPLWKAVRKFLNKLKNNMT